MLTRHFLVLGVVLTVLAATTFAVPIFIDSYPDEHCAKCVSNVTTIMKDLVDPSKIETSLELLCNLAGNKTERQKCKQTVESIISWVEAQDIALAKKYGPSELCSMLSFCETQCCSTPYWPEQIHISLTGVEGEMIVMWTTLQLTETPTVVYGTNASNLNLKATGTYNTYHVCGWHGWIYQVKLTNLGTNTRYFYKVGDPTYHLSLQTLVFDSSPPSNDGSQTTRFAVFGDMDATAVSDYTTSWMTALAWKEEIGLIVHAGDISYSDGYEPIMDQYMRKIEVAASRVPYMPIVGNHEIFWDFVPYKARFSNLVTGTNSGSNTSMYYSFNFGNVHFVAYDCEELFGEAPDLEPGKAQYDWIEQDLQKANANRANQPWIVLFGHRPLYCTSNSDRCTSQAARYRSMIEPLIHQYNVDLVVSGHNHNYERTYPVFNNQTVSFNYQNPTATVYVVAGTAGNKEGPHPSFNPVTPSWSVANERYEIFGYTVITATGSSSLQLQFFDESQTLRDSFTITRS